MNDGEIKLATRQRVVLVLAGADTASHPAALRSAAALAAANVDSLDVIALRPSSRPALLLPPVEVETRWWDCQCPAGDASSPRMTTELTVQALRQIGLLNGDDGFTLLVAADEATEMAARLAASVHGRALGRCVALRRDGEAVVADREIFGGRARIELRCHAKRVVAVLRAPPVAPATVAAAHAPQVHFLELDAATEDESTVEILSGQDSRPAVDGAHLVVSGGRGIGGPEGFELLGRLADKLDGALGGSLPTVDAGWIAAARQIGQSGKFVSPTTYLAVAISGTPQHLAGISSDTRLIAINNDPDAPIFESADIGAVADWRELIPLLLEALDTKAKPHGGG